jgi:hypothetical protein
MTRAPDFNRQTAAIGSLPFTDPDASARFVFECGVDIPFWPQLPRRNFMELMCPQFAEGMPCLAVDAAAKRVWFECDDTKSDRLTAFYEKVLAEDYSDVALSANAAAGYHAFLAELSRRGRQFAWLKGQLTGPLTFTLGLQDQERRPIYYDAELQEAAVKALAAKGVLQVNALRPFADGVLIFLDEPALSAFGTSAYLSLTADDVARLIDEVAEPIHAAGALVGVHCCGNTDWTMFTRTTLDVISFDAFDYADSLALYAGDVKRFLERGGTLAWGIVPTREGIHDATTDGLAKRLDAVMDALSRKGIDRGLLERRALITPSCGTGPIDEPDARKVFRLLAELGSRLKSG